MHFIWVMEIMAVGDGEARKIGVAPIAETGEVEKYRIGGSRRSIGIRIRFLIARVTSSPRRVLREPRTPFWRFWCMHATSFYRNPITGCQK